MNTYSIVAVPAAVLVLLLTDDRVARRLTAFQLKRDGGLSLIPAEPLSEATRCAVPR
jgi:hypothetical protein